jgi:hypothetical protein
MCVTIPHLVSKLAIEKALIYAKCPICSFTLCSAAVPLSKSEEAFSSYT